MLTGVSSAAAGEELADRGARAPATAHVSSLPRTDPLTG